jgi:predicted RNase H-like HicB family nuclease
VVFTTSNTGLLKSRTCPGGVVYGNSPEEAISKVEALALRVLADRLERGDAIPEIREVFAACA